MVTKHKTIHERRLYDARTEENLIRSHIGAAIANMPLEDVKKLFSVQIITHDHCFKMAEECKLNYRDVEAEYWESKADSLLQRDEFEVHSEYPGL